MQCRRCGASIHSGLSICPHCGESQARRNRSVTCTHCRHRAPAASSLCPRCGHTLHARRFSGSMFATIGLVLITSLALSAGVLSRGWDGLRTATTAQLARLESGVDNWGGRVLDAASSFTVTEEEAATPTPSPVVVLAVLPDASTKSAAIDVVIAPTTVGATGGLIAANNITATATLEPTATELPPTATPEPTATDIPPTATPEPTPTDVPPTATPEPTATEVPPTATPQPTATRALPTATTRATLTPTPVRPTATPLSPTATPVRPTATPRPAATATPTPEAAAAAASVERTHQVQSGDNWFTIARQYGLTQEELAAYNNSTPSDVLQVDQILQIPAAGTVTVPVAAAPVIRTYQVQSGDNWYTIALRYGLVQETLAAYNGLTPSSILQVGQTLRIPPSGVEVQLPTAVPVRTYRVQSGDNWYTIALRYGLTQETLAAYNGLTPSSILQVGQTLRIPQ